MLSIIFGLILVALGIFGLYKWSEFLIIFIKGFLPISAAAVGIIAIILGISSLKEK